MREASGGAAVIHAWWTAHELEYCVWGVVTFVILLIVGFVSIGSAIAFRRRQRKNLDAALEEQNRKGRQP